MDIYNCLLLHAEGHYTDIYLCTYKGSGLYCVFVMKGPWGEILGNKKKSS